MPTMARITNPMPGDTTDAKATPLALLKDPTLLKTDGLIDGKWVKGKARFDVIDPATGATLFVVAELGPR